MAVLGEKAVGSIVKLNVNGTPWNFIVVQQGLPSKNYDSSCDGTWLLMEDIYTTHRYHSSVDPSNYSKTEVHTYLNNTFIPLFDDGVQSIIKQVKIPYNGRNTSNGLSTKAFLLSYTEVGFNTSSDVVTEGAVLNYFSGAANSKRVAKFNGSPYTWWLRSIEISLGNIFVVLSDGTKGTFAARYSTQGVRPALILPPDTAVSSDGMVGDSGAITGSVIIGGVQRELTGAGYINIGGVLRDLSDAQTNIGSTLKSLKG